MGESNVNLAALIGSRICHDLISPIGAINNGLELLGMGGNTQGPEMDLISDSVGNAGARIRFFRIAYGAASEQPVGRAEVVGVLQDLSTGSRLVTQWASQGSHPRSEVRLAFLALQCCETAMPFGGTVHLICDAGKWMIIGTADKLKIDTALWSNLTSSGNAQNVTPAQVQFALLPLYAAELGRAVSTDITATNVTIRF